MRVNKKMFNSISAMAIGVLLVSSANAQFSYGTIGGAGTNTRGQDITKDNASALIYVSGTFLNTTTFPSGSGPTIAAPGGGDAAYVSTQDLTGAPVWTNWDIGSGTVSEGITCSVEELSGDDEFFVSGRATGIVQWLVSGVPAGSPGGAGAGTYPITGYYVTCLNKNTGNHYQTFDVPPQSGYSAYQVRSMVHTRRTVGVQVFYDIYICGVAQQAFPAAPAAFVTCVNYHANTTTFTHVWTTMATQAGLSSSQALDIIWNPCSNNICVTGDFVSKIGIAAGGIACTSPSSREAWFCQFNAGLGNALGNTFRAAGTPAGQSSQGTCLVSEPAGGINYAGWFTGNIPNLYCVGNNNVILGGAGAVASLPGIRRSFITMQSCITGGFPWRTVITNAGNGTNETFGITRDPAGASNIYVYGRFNNNTINIPGAGAPYLYTGSGPTEFRSFFCEVNPLNGLLIGGNTTEAPSGSSSDHQPTKIVWDAGLLYSTGRFKGTLNYHPIPFSAAAILGPTPGNYEMYAMRNNAAAYNYFRPSETTGIAEVELTDKQVSIFPNPINDKINLKITDLKGDAKVMIFDQKGSLVKEETISQMNTEIDMSQLSSGLYLVKVKGENIDHSQKIIKQ
jgi:hypothetical protein